MFKYKIDVLQSLKDKGYNTYRILNDKIFGQATVQSFRTGKIVGIKSLDVLCNLLDCQLSDIIEHVKDEE